MKAIKFVLFGWEIIIRPEDYYRCHITEFPERKHVESESYKFEYDIDKRIYTMVGNHQFIEYIFRDFDNALLMYGEYAAQLLEDVMNSLRKIRIKLKEKGATEQHLKIYDDKVHERFEKTVNVIMRRASNKSNQNKKDDENLYWIISSYEIKNYHDKDTWRN